MEKKTFVVLFTIICFIMFWIGSSHNQSGKIGEEMTSNPTSITTKCPNERLTTPPTEFEINKFLSDHNYCEQDSDCSWFYAECPFGCGRAIHKNYVETAKSLIKDFRQYQVESHGMICEYGCVDVQGVKCEKKQCKLILK